MRQKNVLSKRITTMLILVMLSSVFIPFNCIAATTDFNSNEEMVDPKDIQWEYIVYDKDMNVVEQGYVPNSTLRYTWSGVTLKNGEAAVFKPAGKTGLYAEAGTRITAKWTLSRSAKHRTYTDGYTRNFSSGNGFKLEQTAMSGSKSFTAKYTDYFLGMVTNLSSDSFTVKNFSITF